MHLVQAMNDFLNTILAEQEAETSISVLAKGMLIGAAFGGLCLALAEYDSPAVVPSALLVTRIETTSTDTFQNTRSFDLGSELASWELYLSSAAAQGTFSIQQLETAREIWLRASAEIGRICPIPITQRVGDDTLEIAWDNGKRYVDAEIQHDGKFHWYFRDRDAGTIDGTESEPCDSLTTDFLKRLIDVVRT